MNKRIRKRKLIKMLMDFLCYLLDKTFNNFIVTFDILKDAISYFLHIQ